MSYELFMEAKQCVKAYWFTIQYIDYVKCSKSKVFLSCESGNNYKIKIKTIKITN